MSRVRLIMLSVFAVLALSAVASASSASAIGWWVENNARNGSEALPATIKAEFSEDLGFIKSHITLNGITVECTGMSFNNTENKEEPTGSFIEGTTGGRIKNARFTGCAVTNPPGCGITNAIITLLEATLKLEEIGGKAFVKFTPTGTNFASFTFTNAAACGVLANKTINVKGSTKGEIENPAVCNVNKPSEEQRHKIIIKEKPTTLTATGATIEEFELELAPEGLESNGKGSVSNVCWDAK